MSGDAGSEALNDKIQSLLSSPDSMARIQSLMGSLGGDGGLPPGLSDMLSGILGKEPEPSAPPSPAPAAAPAAAPAGMDLSMLSKLAPLLSSVGKEDENTRLLKALRPYLHGEREKRLDEAIQLMQLSRLTPLLKDGGLFPGKGGDRRG